MKSAPLERTKIFILIILFADLTAVAARINIPLPFVSLTMQTAIVLLSGALLGAAAGFASQALYLAMGLLGLPVFALGGGLSYVLNPTFGYLIGFPISAWVTGRLMERKQSFRYRDCVAPMLAGVATYYATGIPYLYYNLLYVQEKSVSIMTVAKMGLLIPLWGDLVKVFLAASLVSRLYPVINRFAQAGRKEYIK